MALGNAATFLIGGFNLVGRRFIGESFSSGDRMREADSFVSLIVADIMAGGLALVIITIYGVLYGASNVFLTIALLSVVWLSLGAFDNVRSAYNEHYITATILFTLQSIAYVIGVVVSAASHSIILGALVIMVPYLLTSLSTAVLLLRTRPYLLSGRPVAVWLVLRQGTMLAMADGFIGQR